MKEKQKALEMALLQIEKQFGKGSIMKLVMMPAGNLSVIPSGSLALDIALGWAASLGAGLWKCTGRNHPVKLPWRFMPLPKHKN